MNCDEYSYIHGRSTAGFIYTVGGQHRFFHTTDEPSRSTMDFPPRCIACSSEMGLVLFYRLANACADANANADADADTLYLVSNPSFAGCERSIPKPPRHHPNPIPRVLIVGWDRTRVCLVFHIVCAVQAANPSSSYSFDVFSSTSNTWESAGAAQVDLGRKIRANTGVACGTRAYWLLDSTFTIAYYNVNGGVVGTIRSPQESPQYAVPFNPHLGRWGSQLCLVAISDESKTVRIFTLEEDDTWLRYVDRPYGSAYPPILSRFQSAKLQVPFWSMVGCKNWLVLLENGWLGRTNMRDIPWPKLDSQRPDIIECVLPHVATDWLPCIHFPLAP